MDSRCPGHPEYRWTSGVETTTGHLGQGLATSVGMAIGRQWLAARYKPPRCSGDAVRQVGVALPTQSLGRAVLPRATERGAQWLASHGLLFDRDSKFGADVASIVRTTVSGVITTKGFRQPDHSRRSVTQNRREPCRGRGRWACKASNCCHNARFSRMRSAGDRNTPVSQPNRCRKRASMAAILSVRWKTTKRAHRSNCGGYNFGE